MPYFQQASESLWQQISPQVDLPKLTEGLETDVCVVGAGIAGLSVAYHLLKHGVKVAVLDKEVFGRNETSLSTAHVSNALDDRYAKLCDWHGEDVTRLAYESHTAAIHRIEQIVMDEKIDCDFKRVNGYLFLDSGHTEAHLQEEMKAAQTVGFGGVEFLSRAPTPIFNTGPCLRFPGQAQMDPLKYLRGLVQAILAMGGQIFERTRAVQIQGGTRSFVKIETGDRVVCNQIVMATHVPVNDLVTMHTKESAYRTYAIAMPVSRSGGDPALFWDTHEAYHYVRVHELASKNYDLLIVGGEDHRVGQRQHPEDSYIALEKWGRDRLGIQSDVLFRWSGQIIEPLDGLAYIGLNPGDKENVYIVSGDSGHGLTHGTIAGMVLSDLIRGVENRYAGIYDPARFNWKRIGQFTRENYKGAIQYADWFMADEMRSPDELLAGEGAIFSDGVHKIAIYKDENGHLHEFSAACPHLKGVIRWNSAEKTWDCPFHGSRFSKYGEVLNGPSMSNLQPRRERAANFSKGLIAAVVDSKMGLDDRSS